jgi:MoaA/NifB/PqqE/SkfB family radical SAM enzyme
VKGVHVSGGEPFLYQRDLRRICTAGHELGIPVAVNTNAFWARHIEAAENVIGSLPGITQLIMSADTYHESFLPLSRVVTAVNVALKRGILVHLCICTPKGQRNEFVERLETALGTEVIDQIEISINPVELGGRADILPEAHWRGVESTWPEGRCWLINRPVILEDGSVLACCNTTVAKKCGQSPLILGSIEHEPLQEILERASQSQLIQAIHLFGPSFLAENLDDESKTKLKGEYVKGDICSLCADMMSNPDLAAAVADIAVSSKTTRLIAVAKALQDHTVP